MLGDTEQLPRRRGWLGRLGRVEAEVVEDLADRHPVGHERDQAHALAAAGADERVDLVDPGDQAYAEFGIRLIAKVFQADPVVCRRCGGPLKVVAYITDSLAIRQILEHLDLSPPEKPPPDTRDVVRVPVDDEGREIELQPA